MKISKSRLKQLIKEEIENIQQESEQMEFDFRPDKEDESDPLKPAMDSWDDWREEQIARDDRDYGEPEESLLIKWMASRGRKSGRKYIHLLPKIAADIGFYKKDLMNAIDKHGTKAMAKALKGYKGPRALKGT